MQDALEMYRMLIDASLSAEIYFEPAKLAKQFQFADKKQIPFVAVQGPEEKARGEITVRRMQSGKQKTIPVNQLIAYLENFYEAREDENCNSKRRQDERSKP
jgi:histidyl-tRNA synthetase